MYFLLMLLLAFFLFSFFQSKETFETIWWNSTRHTRNMSYDIRGEEYYHPLVNLPFNNTELNYI